MKHFNNCHKPGTILSYLYILSLIFTPYECVSLWCLLYNMRKLRFNLLRDEVVYSDYSVKSDVTWIQSIWIQVTLPLPGNSSSFFFYSSVYLVHHYFQGNTPLMGHHCISLLFKEDRNLLTMYYCMSFHWTPDVSPSFRFANLLSLPSVGDGTQLHHQH